MSTIVIQRRHSLSTDEIRSHIEALAERLSETLDASYEWQGDRLDFKRKGASGKISFDESRVDVSVRLGLLMRPLMGQVSRAINGYLDEYPG